LTTRSIITSADSKQAAKDDDIESIGQTVKFIASTGVIPAHAGTPLRIRKRQRSSFELPERDASIRWHDGSGEMNPTDHPTL
jgi:hypothetical protein